MSDITIEITEATPIVLQFDAGIPGADGNDGRIYVIEPTTDLTADGPNTSSKNAGESVTIMQTVYLSSTGVWMLTDAAYEGFSKGLLGIALQTKTTGQAMKVALPGCIVRNDAWAWATVGAPLYLSTTMGQITDAAPSGTDDVVRVIGWALTDNCIYFNPSPDYITLN
jgi:hypothetical protein